MVEERIGGIPCGTDDQHVVHRSVPLSVARGARGRCPACGKGPLFGRFLKVRPACDRCGLVLEGHRADDFPPYVVMFVVGHIVGYAIYVSEVRFGGLDGAALLVWPCLALVLSLVLLQPVKGAVVGLQYALGMHGFAGRTRAADERSGGTGAREVPPLEA